MTTDNGQYSDRALRQWLNVTYLTVAAVTVSESNAPGLAVTAQTRLSIKLLDCRKRLEN